MKHLIHRISCHLARETGKCPREGSPTGSRNTNFPGITLFSSKVLNDFRRNVGRYRAETGGLLGSTGDKKRIDLCHFDTLSRNTSGSFYYDVESMTKVYRRWQEQGYTTNGIYHSHPIGAIRPSFHDISTALLHIRFFELPYFYMPILQSHPRGLYTMYFYIVRLVGNHVHVHLSYVLKADADGSYYYLRFEPWRKVYPVSQLEEYRKDVDKAEQKTPNPDTFSKVRSLFPEEVVNRKVITCVGTGGARSFLENMARCGFRNFILMDADTVSQSNIATQGVFCSELGQKKVDVLRDRIMDINPEARVICVDRFLDDEMSDGEFKSYLDRFPGRKATDHLILGCTDNFHAQKRSAALAQKYGAAYLAAMLYKEGAAAELIFTYPGVTPSCPRCLLRSRYELYESGYENDVTSAGCPIFATERMNALKGYIALMLLLYRQTPGSPFDTLLDKVKDRNFVWIRLNPDVEQLLGIDLFDRALEGAKRYTFMDETVWIPQHPDGALDGEEPCKLCGGVGDLRKLYLKWADTRKL